MPSQILLQAVVVDVPQQTNNFDCGIYAGASLCHWVNMVNTQRPVKFKREVPAGAGVCATWPSGGGKKCWTESSAQRFLIKVYQSRVNVSKTYPLQSRYTVNTNAIYDGFLACTFDGCLLRLP